MEDVYQDRKIISRAMQEEYVHTDDNDIKDSLYFWRANLRRAKRYWAMDVETLDAIQEGEMEDIED